MKAQEIVLQSQGGPDVMELVEIDLAPPKPNEVQIEQTAIGLNYMDIYQRSGHYPMALPSRLGLEAAGRITRLGADVRDFRVGDRVVYAAVLGAYASHRNAPAARMIKIPDTIDDQTAAAVLMKGMTVEYLLNRTTKISTGQDVLFWAASGGVGQIAGQWGRHLGARMIGVTSGSENCATIKALGYADAIDRNTQNVAEQVRKLTGDRGVPVVFDSIGAASFEASIASLATYGLFVSFGATTGEAPAVAPGVLQKNGSLYFTRPTLGDYVKQRSDLLHSAAEVFRLITDGVLKVQINQRYDLADVASAHHALERGETTGSSILIP